MAIINDILDSQKLNRASSSWKPYHFPFRECIESAVRSICNIEPTEKRLLLSLNIEQQIPQFFYGDPTRLSSDHRELNW